MRTFSFLTIFFIFLVFGEKYVPQSARIRALGGGAQCLIIGGQEDIFVFDHILHFDQYPRVQLGRAAAGVEQPSAPLTSSHSPFGQ